MIKKIFIISMLWLSFSAQSLVLTPLDQTPYTGDLDTLQKKGVIRILVSADLGFYYVQKGKPTGIIAELLYYFEKKVHKSYPKVKLQVIPVERDQLITLLNKGFGDIAVANLTVTPEREKLIDFSDPVVTDVKELLITNKSSASFTKLEHFSNQTIWVRESSSYFESLKRINKQLAAKRLPLVNIQFIEETMQDYEIMEMVNQGYINATVLDSHKAHLWLKVMKNIKVHNQYPLRDHGKISWALRSSTPKTMKLVNSFVKESKKGTLLGNVIYKKYINNTKWLTKALSPRELAKVNHLAELFKKYSNTYTFDSLLIAAQAYQESGLDQSKISHRGAVGIMQVLPSTAKDPNVNIRNIHHLENNIHAGVKYMDFIRNRYFEDKDMTDDNKVYFALASYNAGPAKIHRMQKLARQQGYDPHIWFKNVEVIARKHIGRETVTYVSNINRYFVIYQQLTKIQTLRENEQTRLAPINPVLLFPGSTN